MLTLTPLALLVLPRVCPGQQPALAELRAAAAHDPYDFGPAERLAFALRSAGELEASAEAFERAAELGGNGWAFLFNVACAKAALG